MSSDYNIIKISGPKLGEFIRLNTDSTTLDDMSWYSERIDGIVGGDCGLVRRMDNKEVIGIKLQLKSTKVVILATEDIDIEICRFGPKA